jgi:hypothetical protein
LLFNIRPLKDISEVKREIIKIVEKQKRGGPDDLSPFKKEIEALLSSFSEFLPEWKKSPAVFRVARVQLDSDVVAFLDSVVLPDVKHDLALIIKMLNHMREQKGFQAVKMPLFVQPDEISLAHREGRSAFEGGKILSQLALVFQKGAIFWVGFVFGRDYVLLQD